MGHKPGHDPARARLLNSPLTPGAARGIVWGMRDYSPEIYALIEGEHPSGYGMASSASGRGWVLTLAETGEVLDSRERTAEAVLSNVHRYMQFVGA